MNLSKPKMIFLFRKMLEARRFDEKVRDLTQKGQIPLPVHLGIGQEAVGVGMVACLRKSDFLKIHFRGSAHLLTWGADMDRLMAGWFAKDTAISRGRDFGNSGWGLINEAGSIVTDDYVFGAGFGMACGLALASKLKGDDKVTVCQFGDGAGSEGGFHEGLNLSSLWKLPVIFICENNEWAAYTPFKEEHSVENIAVRATGYNMPGVVVDGNDVLAVYEAVNNAVIRAREGKGPSLIECKTYRMGSHHCPDEDFDIEMRRGEIAEWRKRDPICAFREKLTKMGVLTSEEAERINEGVKKMVEASVEFAINSPEPEASRKEALKYIWA